MTPTEHEILEVVDVLGEMPCDPEKFGEAGDDDWTLNILLMLSGDARPDVLEYVQPIIAEAARRHLRRVGFPQ